MLSLLGLVWASVVVEVAVVFVGDPLCFTPAAGLIITGMAVTIVSVPLNAVTVLLVLLGALANECDVSAGTFVAAFASCSDVGFGRSRCGASEALIN